MFNDKVRDHLGLMTTSGDVGIEIEMETQGPLDWAGPWSKSWKIEEDHSLRGYGSEFVLRKPCKFKGVPTLIKNLKAQFKEAGVIIKPTIRAGVHVHVNMQSNKIKDVYKFIMCYYMMETALTNFCGDGRQGNLFCLRARDANYMLYLLEKSINNQDIQHLRTNNLRYSSLNLQSLFTFGSVELRSLGTTPDLDNIEVWCSILQRIKEYSVAPNNCWDNINIISGHGPRQWMEGVLGSELTSLLEYPEMENDIINDLRNVQHICYTLMEEGI